MYLLFIPSRLGSFLSPSHQVVSEMRAPPLAISRLEPHTRPLSRPGVGAPQGQRRLTSEQP